MSDHGASISPPSLSAGTTLGHYEIGVLIGSGGMGQVYRARDRKLQREVALKLLPTETTTDPERRQRFEREARAVAALNHPHIVTIHSVEDVDGRMFLTMELVNGRPLSELIPRGGLPLDRLLKIAVPLADAVSAAHARGITHRDLKPANVMVTVEGSVKVLDFGLAKQHDTVEQADRMETRAADIITGQGRILGTVAYMAPEQAEGKQTDARSDIFSLGVVLYEMATGERPFSGDTSLSTLTAIMRDTPRPVTDINPAIPKELGRVIRRALAKDPDRRQQIGKDLRNELDEIRQELESGELVGQTARAVAAAATPPRRVPWVAVAGGLLVLAAIAAGLGWSRRGSSDTAVIGNDPIAVTVSTVTAEDGNENFPSLSPDGKWMIYGADLESTGVDILLRAVGGQTAINLTKDSPGGDSQAVFSPDGERIAFRSARDSGGLFIMGRTGESVRRLTTEGFNPSWSPDGSAIVYATESVGFTPQSRNHKSLLWTVSTTKDERRQLTTTDAVQPAWSPHGHRIAYWGVFGASVQRDIWTVPAGGGEPVRVTNDPAIDWSPAWSPDGLFLYFVSDRSGAFSLWRVRIDEATGRTTGDPVAVPIPRQWIGHLSFSADGTLLAMAAMTGQANIEALAFDPDKESVGARRRVTNGSETSTTSASVSRDGQWLAFNKILNGQEDLWVVKTDGTGLRQVTNDAAHDRRPEWSADGKRLLFYSDRVTRYQAWMIGVDGGGLTQLTELPELLIYPVWSPDGSRAVASLPIERRAVMFDPHVSAKEQRVEDLPAFTGGGFRPTSWSPDGTRVAGQANRPAQGLVIYTLATRTYQELGPGGGEPVWLPDSRRMLYPNGSTLMLIDTATGRSKEIFSAPRESLFGAAVSPTAREIYVNIAEIQSDIVLAKRSTGVTTRTP